MLAWERIRFDEVSTVFVPISNTPRDYDWGSSGRISALLGAGETDAIEAELWLGAHDASPARVHSDAVPQVTLDEWIRADTQAALGHLTQLPFLLKVLAAEAPLSLQVHPSREYAARAFAEEEKTGIPRDAAYRNYRDPNHKPELILALEDGFTALCGVRPEAERRRIVEELGINRDLDAEDVRATFERLLTQRESSEVRSLVDRAVAAAAQMATTDSLFRDAYRWVGALATEYPGDPGVVLSLFLNLVTLRAGEALYLPAGNLHAYLRGIGIEVMAASDNVLRGGLTSKHIDVPELLAVADMDELPVPIVRPEHVDGALRYSGDAREFELLVVHGDAHIALSGPAIALNLGERATLRGAQSEDVLSRGDARFITLDEGTLQVSADHLVLAQPQAGWAETSA